MALAVPVGRALWGPGVFLGVADDGTMPFLERPAFRPLRCRWWAVAGPFGARGRSREHLNKPVHGLVQVARQKRGFTLLRKFNGLRHRIWRHIHVPRYGRSSSDLPQWTVACSSARSNVPHHPSMASWRNGHTGGAVLPHNHRGVLPALAARRGARPRFQRSGRPREEEPAVHAARHLVTARCLAGRLGLGVPAAQRGGASGAARPHARAPARKTPRRGMRPRDNPGRRGTVW